MKQVDPIVNKLRQQQTVMGMTDELFALHLGISRTLWSLTKDGETPVGMSLLAGVMHAFPGMKDDVAAAVARYRTVKQSRPVVAV